MAWCKRVEILILFYMSCALSTPCALDSFLRQTYSSFSFFRRVKGHPRQTFFSYFPGKVFYQPPFARHSSNPIPVILNSRQCSPPLSCQVVPLSFSRFPPRSKFKSFLFFSSEISKNHQFFSSIHVSENKSTLIA